MGWFGILSRELEKAGLLLGLSLFVCCSDDFGRPSVEALKSELREVIASSGAEVGLAFRTLDGEYEVLIDSDRSFHAASTMKIPVMIELYRQSREGRLSLDDRIEVVNQFKSIVDGSTYSLSAADDSDQEVYTQVGTSRSLRELCEAMIVVSSNLATNILIERLGVEGIRQTLNGMGASGMRVLRGVEDGKAYRQGLNNTTDAHSLMMLLHYIGTGRAVDLEASREMAAILRRQQFNEGIPSGLPVDVLVAHKTGQITAIHHDAGIVYGRPTYILVVLTEGIEDENLSAALIGDISRRVYQWTREIN